MKWKVNLELGNRILWENFIFMYQKKEYPSAVSENDNG